MSDNTSRREDGDCDDARIEGGVFRLYDAPAWFTEAVIRARDLTEAELAAMQARVDALAEAEGFGASVLGGFVVELPGPLLWVGSVPPGPKVTLHGSADGRWYDRLAFAVPGQ